MGNWNLSLIIGNVKSKSLYCNAQRKWELSHIWSFIKAQEEAWMAIIKNVIKHLRHSLRHSS